MNNGFEDDVVIHFYRDIIGDDDPKSRWSRFPAFCGPIRLGRALERFGDPSIAETGEKDHSDEAGNGAP